MVLIFLICFAADNRPPPIAALDPRAVEYAIKLQERERGEDRSGYMGEQTNN